MAPNHVENVTSTSIYEQFRGLIASGYLGEGERLPTIRQTASDMGVSPGTAARAFRQLEQDGLVVTRTGAGTRVARGASPLPASVVAKIRALVQLGQAAGSDLDEIQSAIRAVWDAHT